MNLHEGKYRVFKWKYFGVDCAMKVLWSVTVNVWFAKGWTLSKGYYSRQWSRDYSRAGAKSKSSLAWYESTQVITLPVFCYL